MQMTTKSSLKLACFFPYQLTQLQASVSDCIAEIYTGKFNLSRQEWRILAILASHSPLTAKQIGAQTNLEKMPASRAIQRMLDKALLIKDEHVSDKRSSLLRLSEQGQKLYQQLEPMVLRREQEILSILNDEEQQALASILTKLQLHATSIATK